MRGAGAAIARGAGHAAQKVEQFFEERPVEELQRRVALRDAVFTMAGTDEFKAFHADAVERIKSNTRELLALPTKDFNGVEGVELRGKVLGQEDVFLRMTTIITEGTKAEAVLAQREYKKAQGNGEKHTNLTAD